MNFVSLEKMQEQKLLFHNSRWCHFHKFDLACCLFLPHGFVLVVPIDILHPPLFQSSFSSYTSKVAF